MRPWPSWPPAAMRRPQHPGERSENPGSLRRGSLDVEIVASAAALALHLCLTTKSASTSLTAMRR